MPQQVGPTASVLGEMTVLAVDDNTSTLRLIVEIARAGGVGAMHTRTTALEALNALNDLRPDVLLVDWQMPNLDGLMLTKIIRAAALNPDPLVPDPKVPIIMVTGRRREVDVEAARLAGVTEFIIKPFAPGTLMTRLQTVVSQARSFVVADRFVGPDRRRRRSDDYVGPKRRVADPDAAVDINQRDQTRAVIRNGLDAVRDLQAQGGDTRAAVALCYTTMRDAFERSRAIRDTAIEQASNSLVRYVEAVGGPQNADPQVVNVHMDALGKLLVLGDGSRAARLVNERLGAAVGSRMISDAASRV